MYGDICSPAQTLDYVFRRYGIEPPPDCATVKYSDVECEESSDDDDSDVRNESDDFSLVRLSSVNLEYLPESFRSRISANVSVPPSHASSTISLENCHVEGADVVCRWKFIVSVRLLVNTFTLKVREISESLVSLTNSVICRAPRCLIAMVKNVSILSMKMLKYSILLSFGIRSVKYVYLHHFYANKL